MIRLLFYSFVIHIVETFRFEADVGSLKAYSKLYDLKLKPKANILLFNISSTIFRLYTKTKDPNRTSSKKNTTYSNMLPHFSSTFQFNHNALG